MDSSETFQDQSLPAEHLSLRQRVLAGFAIAAFAIGALAAGSGSSGEMPAGTHDTTVATATASSETAAPTSESTPVSTAAPTETQAPVPAPEEAPTPAQPVAEAPQYANWMEALEPQVDPKGQTKWIFARNGSWGASDGYTAWIDPDVPEAERMSVMLHEQGHTRQREANGSLFRTPNYEQDADCIAKQLGATWLYYGCPPEEEAAAAAIIAATN